MFHRTKSLLLVAVLVVSIVLSVPGCASPQEGEAISPHPEKVEEQKESVTSATVISSTETVPTTVDLEMSKAPKLNEIVEVAWTIRSTEVVPNCVASVELPEGAIKIDGDLSWSGALKQDIPVQLFATIKFVKEGDWAIRAVARRIVDEISGWSDVDYIFLTVKKDQGEFIEFFEAGPVESEPVDEEKADTLDSPLHEDPPVEIPEKPPAGIGWVE